MCTGTTTLMPPLRSTAVPRVAYVLWHFPKLSETFVVEELLALRARGVHPDIVARERYDEPVSNPHAEELMDRACWLRDGDVVRQVLAVARVSARHPLRVARCIGVAIGTASRWTLVNLWFGLVLADLVRRRELDYLHAHFADDAAELAYFASSVTGVPFGVTAHGVDIYVNRFLCRKLRAAALVVTVCEYNARQLVERCPALERRDIVLKYAGIDPRRFAAPESVDRPGVPTVVAVGRLVPKKGFDLLVRAVGELHGRGMPLRCVIVGSGPEEERLRRLAHACGVADVVDFAGPLPPGRVAEVLATADVLAAPCTIAPTGDRDSMPVVIKEAMAMGVPVVATDDFGIPELVTPDAGHLVRRDDPSALAAGLAEVLDLRPEQRAAMGRAGREVIRSRFDERELVETLARCFCRFGVGAGKDPVPPPCPSPGRQRPDQPARSQDVPSGEPERPH